MLNTKKVLLFLNVVLIFLTIGAYIAPYGLPSQFPLVALLGLAYPALLMTNLLFIIFWLVIHPRWAVGSIVTILLGFSSLLGVVGFHPALPQQKVTKSIKLGTFNLQFGKPITLQKGSQRAVLTANYQAYLKEFAEMEVFCVKEQNQFNQQQIAKSLDFPFRYGSPGDYLEIYSKYPIINSGTFPKFSENQAIHCIWSDIVFQTDTIRVYNVHLEPNSSDGRKTKRVADKASEPPIDWSMAFGLVKFYAASATKRVQQVQQIKDHQKDSPYPTITCIDLNDTPQSYVYHLLNDQQKDSFLEKGNGLGATFGSTLGNRMLSLRIDYIFCDQQLEVLSHDVSPNAYSDHHLVTAEITW